MYEFNWEGKELAYKLAQTPSTGTLIPDKESSKNWDDTENLYIEGDNLEVLKLLQKSYFGKVKMIYIDPPYNTGKDFVYKDNFRDNIANYKDITNQTTKANPETNGRYHTNWLNMMYPRLKLARNLLREDGVIFISIDDIECNNLRKLCDEIFGEENFVASLPTVMNFKGNNNQFGFSGTHELTIVYMKNINSVDDLNGISLTEEDKKEYIFKDYKGYYKQGATLMRTGEAGARNKRPKGYYPIYVSENLDRMSIERIDKSDYEIYPRTREGKDMSWRRSKDNLSNTIEEFIIKENNRNISFYKKQRLEDDLIRGKKAKTLFYKPEYSSGNGTKIMKDLFNERIFDNPKPIELLKDLIKIGTNSSSIVLDFFSGSSTTAHAVMQLNTEDKGNRKFIMVQLPELTDEKSEAYKSGYKNICEIGKERIRRAGDKIVSENKDKEGIENLDIGFKVFKLAYNNLNNKEDDEMYNEKLIELSNKTNIICRQHQVYELNDMYFYILQTEEEYIQWRYKYDILWSTETSEEFYNKIINPIKIEILTNKKPKELKGKKKIATINKDADYKVQVFIDDDCNLYYQDNHAFASCESKIVDNKVETTWNSCKCWFKIIGLYKCRNNHIVDILRDLNSYSEYLYPENNVADNVMLSRLYDQMVNVYLDYVNN